MSEPVWLHLQVVNGANDQPHQMSRACYCNPVFAIDVRPTLGRDDVRVLLHRTPGDDAAIGIAALHSRKGEFVELT